MTNRVPCPDCRDGIRPWWLVWQSAKCVERRVCRLCLGDGTPEAPATVTAQTAALYRAGKLHLPRVWKPRVR